MDNVLEILNTRESSARTYGHAYKLIGNQYAQDFTVSDDLVVDETEMSVVFPFADGNNRDGQGDVIEIAGIDTSRHILNPIILFDHGQVLKLPIGSAQDPKTKQYTVNLDVEKRIASCKAFFYQNEKGNDHAKMCEQLFDMVARKMIRGGSIGYMIKDAVKIPSDYRADGPNGVYLKSVLMLEASITVLPANKDTVMKSLSDNRLCGRPIVPALYKSLCTCVGESKSLTVGNTGWLNEEQRKIENQSKLSQIRKHYRQTKNLRMRRKRSAPGTSILLVRSKDLSQIKKMAETEKLELLYMGRKDLGTEKIKLIGDDTSIDNVARQYGIPIKKKSRPGVNMVATATAKGKIGKKNMEAVPGEEARREEEQKPREEERHEEHEEASKEPVSSQVLRRIHQDASDLMQEYHEWMEFLEHEGIKDHLVETLQELEERLQTTEALFAKHHPNQEPLENSENSEVDDKSVEVDAENSEEEEPTGKEAMEGMENGKKKAEQNEPEKDNSDTEPKKEDAEANKKEAKEEKQEEEDHPEKEHEKKNLNIRSLYKKKSMCGKCGKSECSCGGSYGKKSNFDKLEHKVEKEGYSAESARKIAAKVGQEKYGKEGMAKKAAAARGKALEPDEMEENQEPQQNASGDNPEARAEQVSHESKGFNLHEIHKKSLYEAHHFLGGLMHADHLEEGHRMEAFHHHKNLEGIIEHHKSMGDDDQNAETQSDMAGEETGMGMKNYSEMQKVESEGEPREQVESPQIQAIGHASQYCKMVSMSRDFGDRHRFEAEYHHKNLGEILNSETSPEKTADESHQSDEGKVPESGEIDAKSLKTLCEQQQRDIEELNKRISAIRF